MSEKNELNSHSPPPASVKIYEFDQFKDFFEHQLREKNIDDKGRKISTLNSLAKKLGYNSASLLSMIAKGARLPSQSLLDALFEEWNIDPINREFVRLRVEIERSSKKGKNTYQLLTKLNKLAADKDYYRLDVLQFESVREWYMMVLRVMVDQPGFREDPVELSQILRRKVSPSEIERALKTLQDIGLLRRDSATGKLQTATGSTETTHEVPSEAIREHHRGMLNRALEALEEQPVPTRHFNSLTMSFVPQHLPEVKQKILDFLKQLNQEYGHNISPNVYQLNIQFFEHTNLRNQEIKT